MKESHVADLEFGDQLLNFALKRFHAICFENSLPIAFDQGLPFRGVKRGGKDFPRQPSSRRWRKLPCAVSG